MTLFDDKIKRLSYIYYACLSEHVARMRKSLYSYNSRNFTCLIAFFPSRKLPSGPVRPQGQETASPFFNALQVRIVLNKPCNFERSNQSKGSLKRTDDTLPSPILTYGIVAGQESTHLPWYFEWQLFVIIFVANFRPVQVTWHSCYLRAKFPQQSKLLCRAAPTEPWGRH